MAIATFDTLKFPQRLERAGFEKAQVAGLAEAQREALGEALDNQVATKADIATVKTDIAEVKADILKWMFGALLAQTAIIAALVKL